MIFSRGCDYEGHKLMTPAANRLIKTSYKFTLVTLLDKFYKKILHKHICQTFPYETKTKQHNLKTQNLDIVSLKQRTKKKAIKHKFWNVDYRY